MVVIDRPPKISNNRSTFTSRKRFRRELILWHWIMNKCINDFCRSLVRISEYLWHFSNGFAIRSSAAKPRYPILCNYQRRTTERKNKRMQRFAVPLDSDVVRCMSLPLTILDTIGAFAQILDDLKSRMAKEKKKNGYRMDAEFEIEFVECRSIYLIWKFQSKTPFGNFRSSRSCEVHRLNAGGHFYFIPVTP